MTASHIVTLAASVLFACGGAQPSGDPVSNSASSQTPAEPASEPAPAVDGEVVYCGCGEDNYTEFSCPANGRGPLSKGCKAAPATKMCGCPGDSPCGGDPCGGDWSSPCAGGENPCAENPCGDNPCGW